MHNNSMSRPYAPLEYCKHQKALDLLNEFAIYLKKGILSGAIKGVTIEQVDEGTLPALFALDSIREPYIRR